MTNPFATRYVRPGALAYRFAVGESAEQFVERLAGHGWMGQIVGPHGSGKSTLIAAMLPALAAAGRQTVCVTLRRGERRLPCVEPRDALGSDAPGSDRLASDAQWVIDGYEQLSRMTRWRLMRRFRRLGCGILVTSHHDIGLPTIARVEPNLETMRYVVAQLLPDGDRTVNDDDIAAAWQHCGGNLREALFGLYDLYELRGCMAD